MTFRELWAHTVNLPLKLSFVPARITYSVLRYIAGPILKKKKDFHGESIKPEFKGTYLLVSNHGEPLDPAYQMIAVKDYYRFIASDHLLSAIPGAPIIMALGRPIIKFQTRTSDTLYTDMLLSLKNHINVMVSVEGRMTNTGVTGYISKRNATLIKEAGCGLITYRLSGGYLRHPRWADHARKGPLYGEVVHQYSPEECAAMTEEEIFRHMKEDLYVNCYDDQRKNPHKYHVKNPAQSAELVLYCCPHCHELGTLKTQNDTISCPCGFEAKVDDYGFWHGDMEFDNIADWDKWQKTVVKALAEEKRGTTDHLLSDKNQRVLLGSSRASILFSECADVDLYADRFEIRHGDDLTTIPLSELRKIDYAGRDELQLITKQNEYYHIHSPYPRSATKYQHLVRYLLGKEND